MKQFIACALILAPFTSFANTADWVVETSTLLLTGKPAVDLYMSLNASEVMDGLSTNYDQLRTKKNEFATCSAHFYRVDTNDDTEWVIQDEATCQIHAPKGSTINQ